MKVQTLKTYRFHTKLSYQKPMLRQTKWWGQNGPIKKNGVLPVTNSVIWKFSFSLGTSYKEPIWCTNNPNAHIRTFCEQWSFIWRCFSPVSILKGTYKLVFEALYFDVHKWWKNSDNSRLKKKCQRAKQISDSVNRCSWSFTKFTRKHLCRSLLFHKVVFLQLVLLFKKRLQLMYFSVNYTKFLITPIL